MHRSLAPTLALTMAALAALATTARAEDVKVRFEFEVDYVDDSAGLVTDSGFDVEVGDVISGVYTYDTEAVDTNAEPRFGIYTSSGAPYGIELDVPGDGFESDNVTTWIVDDRAYGSGRNERYEVWTRLRHADVELTFVFYLENFTASATPLGPWSSDELPVAPPSIDDFHPLRNHVTLSFRWLQSRDADGVYGRLTVLELAEQEVDIDIRPGSDTNPLNPDARGTLPVAILGSEELDVADVDVASVRLAGASVAANPQGTLRASIEDVNDDGIDDLVLHFDIQALEVDEDTTELSLTGELEDGTAIVGSDSVQVL